MYLKYGPLISSIKRFFKEGVIDHKLRGVRSFRKWGGEITKLRKS